MLTVTANRDLAELARQHAADAEPGSLDRCAWGCLAVALTTTGTTMAATPCSHPRHCPPATGTEGGPEVPSRVVLGPSRLAPCVSRACS